MNIKTMEGIVGAKTNMDLVNTPMRVFKDARRRGDLSVMERAMGFVDEFSGKAKEYQSEAKEGMEEDAKEAKEIEETLREKLIETRREEREKLEDERKEDREIQVDTVELSEEGKALLKNHGNLESKVSIERNMTEGIKPVTFEKAEEGNQTKERKIGISISV